MSDWNTGYVTDIAYTNGWYRQQSPAMIALACLLGGVDMPIPAADDPIHYLELGCGQGYGAMVLAASNPTWRVTAVDFNPAHIAAARAWAAEAQLTNISFIEGNLATLAEEEAGRQIPPVDFASLHGVWSWVSQSVQDGIVRLLGNKVRAGGAVHVSYNCMPAWGPAIGMQRLLRESGKRLAWRSDRQAEEGLSIVRAMLEADSAHLKGSSFTTSLIPALDKMPAAYLAHEYMNESWKPCFMADVAAAFAGAKLEFVASSQLIENFPALMLNDAQRAVSQKFEDPLMRELVKDMSVERSLRHDVYVRGAQRTTNANRDAVLMNIVIETIIEPEALPLEVRVPAGQAELSPAFYKPIVRAASKAASRVGDLLALPDVQGRRDNPAELLGMLVGLEIADVVMRPGAEPGLEAMRFNSVSARRFVRSENLGRIIGVASRRMGTATACRLLDLVVMERLRDGATDMDELFSQIDPLPTQADEVREMLKVSLHQRIPRLRAAGVF